MKRSIIISIMLFIPFIMNGMKVYDPELKRFTFGTEWGYVSSFHCGMHHNFFSDVGYRVDIRSQDFGYLSNADAYLHFGYNLDENWNLSLYAGIAGVYDIHKIIPLSIRTTRYFRPSAKDDRWFAFLDAGSGISTSSHPQATLNGKLGAGYRISLSRAAKLDFSLAFRMTLTHPEIEYDGYLVDFSKINRNNAYVSAIAISMTLTL